MSKKPHVKGRELEESVYFIQKNILETDSKYRGQAFTIERNQIVFAGGVRHELDVVVKVQPGADYEALVLFECKNWKKKVGKNEVIIFSEKIRAVAASRGFIVAANWTKDAESQARKDSRVKLVKCSNDFQSPLSAVQMLHQTTDLLNIEVHARIVGPDRLPTIAPFDIDAIWTMSGSPIVLRTFIKGQADRLYSEKFQQDHQRLQLEGTHEGVARGRILFDNGEMVSLNQELEWMELTCHYRVSNALQKLRSRFEVKGYGRTYSFEPINDAKSGKAITVTIVERNNKA